MFILAIVLLFTLAVVLPLAALKASHDNGNILNQLDTHHGQTQSEFAQIEHNQRQILSNEQAICAAIPECLLKGVP